MAWASAHVLQESAPNTACHWLSSVVRKQTLLIVFPAETARGRAQGQKAVSLLWGVIWPGLYFKDDPLAVKKRLDGGRGGAESKDAPYPGTGLGGGVGTREGGTDLRDVRKARNSYLTVSEVGETEASPGGRG